jgi:hypothetical protein
MLPGTECHRVAGQRKAGSWEPADGQGRGWWPGPGAARGGRRPPPGCTASQGTRLAKAVARGGPHLYVIAWPAASSSSLISGLASETLRPAYWPTTMTPSVKPCAGGGDGSDVGGLGA